MTQPPLPRYRYPLSRHALCRTASACRLRHAPCVLSRDMMTDRTQPGVSHAFGSPRTLPPLLNSRHPRFHPVDGPTGKSRRAAGRPRIAVLYEFWKMHSGKGYCEGCISGRSAKSTDVGVETHRLSAEAGVMYIPGDSVL